MNREQKVKQYQEQAQKIRASHFMLKTVQESREALAQLTTQQFISELNLMLIGCMAGCEVKNEN